MDYGSLNSYKIGRKKRRELFELYKSKLSSIDGLICPNEVKHNEIDAYHLFIIKIKPNEWSISRNDIIEEQI